METEEYLNLVLQKESITDDSPEIKALRAEKEKVEKIILDAFDGKPVIRYAGSYKKGTMVRGSYDLDVICYFKYDDDSAGDNLEDIFNNVKKSLENDYFVFPKKSALRLQGKNDKLYFHIDVVPGRFVDESESDAFLYQSEGDKKRLKTNLDVHISHIKDSGLTKTIKLAKVWKGVYALNVKTFALELLVIKIVDDLKDKNGIGECLKKLFSELDSNIENIAIEDPANPVGNDLSGLFDGSIKGSLSIAAKSALKSINDGKWEDLFGPVEDASKDYIVDSLRSNASSSANGPKPWLDI
jgi:hypothetical protein